MITCRAVFTIVTQNHLHYAQTLMASVMRFHPDVSRFIVLVDEPDELRPESNFADYLYPEDLNIPCYRRFLFQYTAFELCCALKPFVFRHLASTGCLEVIYFDSDICVYSPLNDLYNRLTAFPILLTPHITESPPDDGLNPSAAALRRAGAYNAGFLAIRKSTFAESFLTWWCAMCQKSCIVDWASGIHVDQGWLDLVPGLFDGVEIVKSSGCNVAYWNVLSRPITRGAAGEWLAAGEPLVFFHFSGFCPDSPELLSRHQNRIDTVQTPILLDILKHYAEQLEAYGRKEFQGRPYRFDSLLDGTSILRLWREAIRKDHPLLTGVEDPFDTLAPSDVRSRFKRAARDMSESREDWRIQGDSFLDRTIRRLPLISDLYLTIRRRIRG